MNKKTRMLKLKQFKERVVYGFNLRRRRSMMMRVLQDPAAAGFDPNAAFDANGNPAVDFNDFKAMPGIQLTEPTDPILVTTEPTPQTTPSDVDESLPSGELMNGDIPTIDEETTLTNASNMAALLGGEGNEDFDKDGFPILNDEDEFEPVIPGSVEGAATFSETVTAPSDSTAAAWTVPTNGPNGAVGDAVAGSVANPAESNEAVPTTGPGSAGDAMAGSVAAPSDTTSETFPTNGPDSVAGDPMAGAVPTPGQDEDTGDVDFGPGSKGDSMAGVVPAGQDEDEDTGDVDFGPGSKGDSMAGEYSGESSTPQISGGGGSSTYGSSAYGSGSAAATSASAIVTGDAGLFCDTDPAFTYTSLWNGGSFKAFEAEIASESANNTSEEVARNAILIALPVGALMATILTIEFLLGRKMCLEKWLVGLLALVACGSQGATFAFFNSQRYCDGDILHEILNQEPCVLGQGGIMSIVAVLLYFLTLLLVCKVPEADPYGLCCRGRKSDGAERVFQGEGDGMLMGSNPNDTKPERPGWISEDNRNEEEENEII